MNIINHKKYFDLNYRFPKEEFKSIEGYERYRVSNWGRVSSHNNLILKPIPNGNGYYVINLYKENPGKTPLPRLIYRLVALNFVEIPEGKDTVNHLDWDKGNNHYSNLEWVTQSENSQYGTNKKWAQRVYEVDYLGSIINTYDNAIITPCTTGNLTTTQRNKNNNTFFFYEKDIINNNYLNKIKKKHPKYIEQLTYGGKHIAYHINISAAAIKNNILEQTIWIAIKRERPTKDFIWKKVDNPI